MILTGQAASSQTKNSVIDLVAILTIKDALLCTKVVDPRKLDFRNFFSLYSLQSTIILDQKPRDRLYVNNASPMSPRVNILSLGRIFQGFVEIRATRSNRSWGFELSFK